MWIFKKPAIAGLILFIVLMGYFFVTYSYYPGLKVSVKGEVAHDISGRIYWDYGYGFNNDDYIDMRLTAGKSDTVGNLGEISVRPVGLRNELSRGDMVWLVLSKSDYEAGQFAIHGKHKWMHWVTIKHNQKGRQLALFPGASIVFKNIGLRGNIKIFKTPDSGYAEISTKSGLTRYRDCYGSNRLWEVTRFEVQKEGTGPIQSLSDPYRRRDLSAQPLPHQRIYGIKYIPDPGDIISKIVPIQKLTLVFNRAFERPSDISFEELAIDGKKIILLQDKQDVQSLKNIDGVEVVHAGNTLTFSGKIQSFAAILSAENTVVDVISSGINNEDLNDATTLTDNGMAIHAYGLIDRQALKITQMRVVDSFGNFKDFRPDLTSEGVFSITDLRGIQQTAFSPLLFGVQIATAGFASFLFFCFLRLPIFTKCTDLKNAGKVLFWNNGRWFFWLVFFTGIIINGLWLMAEWPGCLTPDSVHVHTELKKLTITNHHPYIYSLFVLALYNFYDSPLSIIIFQILTFHGLIAYIMYFASAQGVKRYILYPICLLTFCSIPVNVFNITVWKDIPYTTLVLFWSVFLAICFHAKYYRKRSIELSIRDAVLLSVLFLALCTFRHNGVVYIAYVPLCLWCFSNISRKWLAQFCLFSSVLFVVFYLVLPAHVLYKKPSKNSFSKVVVDRTIKKASAVVTEQDEDEGYYLEHYLAERVRRFTASLGTSPKATTWFNDMHNPPQRWFAVDNLKSQYTVAPKSAYLSNIKNKLLQTRSYQGLTEGRFLHWNSLFGLVALSSIFILYKWLPLSAYFSCFFLFQAGAMFFVVWPRWRYLYFLYLGGLYIAFFLLIELKSKKILQAKG